MAERAVVVEEVGGAATYWFDTAVDALTYLRMAQDDGYFLIPANSRFAQAGTGGTARVDRYFPVARLISVA